MPSSNDQVAVPGRPEFPRALRREGLVRRVIPFAVTGLVIIALSPLVIHEVDIPKIELAFAIDGILVLAVMLTPWSRLPAWTEAILPMLGFPLVALVRDATGGEHSVLNALGMLVIFWFAMHGTPRQLYTALAASFMCMVIPVYLIGPPRYPDDEVIRAVLWTVLAGVISFAVQRIVQSQSAVAREAEHVADLRTRANDELREADELKSQFVAMVSHELRTPLTSIRGFAHTIQQRYEELSDDDRRHFAQIIEDQAERLSRLVENLLLLSRIESGPPRSRPVRIGVVAAIDQAVAQFPAQQVEVRCAPHLEVHVDPDHLEQILVNYLGNAERYGAAPFVVSAARIGSEVHIVVQDGGDGVDPEFVPALFERFTQAPGHMSDGTGLGLSIVRGLANAEGGDAWYEPGPDGGSCFVVSLPVAEPDPMDDDEPTTQIAILDH